MIPPSNLPTKAENVSIVMSGIAGFLALGAFIAGNVLFFKGITAGYASFNIVAGAAFVISLVSIIYYGSFSKERMSRIYDQTETMMLTSAETPDFGNVTSRSPLLYLNWTIDHGLATRLLLTNYFFGPYSRYALPLILAAQLALARHNKFAPELFISWPPPLLALLSAIQLSKRQYSHVPVQHYGLVTDVDGITIVSGKTLYQVPWKLVGLCWETSGSVQIVFNGLSKQIPPSAFHAAGDAKAFAAAVKAFKRGKQPPVHDWSSYGVTFPTTEGSWPPVVLPDTKSELPK